MTNDPAVLELLDQLAQLQAALALTRSDLEAKRETILKPVALELAELEAEYAPLLETAANRIAALEEEVKAAVLLVGESVKGADLHAVYIGGRVTWDTRRLDGYAAAHPEVLPFRKEGAPSVSIRPSR